MNIIFAASGVFFLFVQMLGMYWLVKTIRNSVRMSSVKMLLVFLFVAFFVVVAVGIRGAFLGEDYVVMFSLIGAGVVEVFFIRRFVRMRRSEYIAEERAQAEAKQVKDELIARPEDMSRQLRAFSEARRHILEYTSGAIRREEQIETMLLPIAKLMKTHVDADGCAVVPFDDFDNVLVVKAFEGDFPPPYRLPDDLPRTLESVRTHFKTAEFRLEDSVFGQVARSGKPVVFDESAEELRSISNGSEDFLKFGSVMIFPLVHAGRVLGVVGFSRNFGRVSFSAREFDAAAVLTDNVTNAMNLFFELEEERESYTIENETDIASKIQQTLIPKRLKKVGRLTPAVYFAQAQGVCSDYYDIIQVQASRVFFVLLDVAGKSIQAGIAMVMVRSILYLVANTRQSLTSIFEWLNRGITGKINLDNYASLSVVEYNPGSNQLNYISAGRQNILVWRAKTRKIQVYRQEHDPIGVDSHSKFVAETIGFEKNDILVLYTDGVVEALNKRGQPFGLNTLKQLVAQHSGLSAQDITRNIEQQLAAFMATSAKHDDHTVLVVKYTG